MSFIISLIVTLSISDTKQQVPSCLCSLLCWASLSCVIRPNVKMLSVMTIAIPSSTAHLLQNRSVYPICYQNRSIRLNFSSTFRFISSATPVTSWPISCPGSASSARVRRRLPPGLNGRKLCCLLSHSTQWKKARVFALLKLYLVDIMYVSKKNPLDQSKKARVFVLKSFFRLL